MIKQTLFLTALTTLVIGTSVSASDVLVVAGTTNNNTKLAIFNNSIKVTGYDRQFNYAVLDIQGNISINYNTKTSWCRYGSIQLDNRGRYKSSVPGWYLTNGRFIAADSEASINLLNRVCSK